MEFHTVYNSFESGPQGRDYIGKHSAEDPYDDYKGSFKDELFDPDNKIVFAYAKTAEGAIWLEMMFQKVFNVVEDPQYANKAYQTSLGWSYDRTGDKSALEHCRKIAEALRGRKKTEESIKKRQETRGAYPKGEHHPMFGVNHTEEAIKKIKEARAKQINVSGGCSHPWWVNELGERTRSETSPGEKWQRGMEWDPRADLSDGKNRRWVNKEGKTKRSRKHPGEGWQNGSKWKS